MVLEPKEKDGEVTLQQKENPCIVVDVGKGNICTINNLRMILKGPNKDADPRSYQAEMDFEKHGSEKCMLEFFTHKPDEMYTVILLKSGILKLNGCIISLDGIFKETYRKVPCVTVLHNTQIEMKNVACKGDTTNGASTAGVIAFDADVLINECTFAHFKSGGIMIQSKPQTIVEITNNTILSCETNGVYIQGRSSKPNIIQNRIAFCRCSAITTNLDVNANIEKNEM